ncbi:MAG: hypothetical protein V7K71_13515 [Nostoc sp.]
MQRPISSKMLATILSMCNGSSAIALGLQSHGSGTKFGKNNEFLKLL